MSCSTAMRRAATAAFALALGAGTIVTATDAQANPANGRHAYPGSVPSFVSAKADAGPAADTTVEGEVFLPLQNEVAAQKLAMAVSTPGNAKYGKTLSPEEWIARFSPTQSDFNQVRAYLKQSGLTIFAAPASRQYIVFRGPAPATKAAFGTSLHNYRVNGSTVSAPATAPSLPAAIASKVSAISLGNSRSKLTRPSSVRPGSGTGEPQKTAPKAGPKAVAASSKCSSYYGENNNTDPEAYGQTSFPTYICGYTPKQLRSAGGVNQLINSGVDGRGQTVAIIDAYASPTIVQDTNDYMRQNGAPLLTNYKQIVPKPSEFVDQAACQEPSGWQGEQTLDVESAHGVAPGAGILYVGGFNCGGGLDIALSKILDKKLANIVSNSYGNLGEAVPDDVLRGQQDLHIQAAAEGIGLYFSSGDSGDEATNLGYTSPDFPASSPFVTAVGGTSEAIGADGSYLGETGWGDTLDQIKNNAYTSPLPGDLYGGGAGGGVSANFAQPAYQRGVVPTALAKSRGGDAARVVPDIADLADPYTGFLIGLRPITNEDTLETGPYMNETYGGTSLASPLAAAKMALIQAKTKRVIGFANPALYAASQNNPAAFHDVKAGTITPALDYLSPRSGNHYLVTLNQGYTLSTQPGYDTMTGVGSLVTPKLAQALR